MCVGAAIRTYDTNLTVVVPCVLATAPPTLHPAHEHKSQWNNEDNIKLDHNNKANDEHAKRTTKRKTRRSENEGNRAETCSLKRGDTV